MPRSSSLVGLLAQFGESLRLVFALRLFIEHRTGVAQAADSDARITNQNRSLLLVGRDALVGLAQKIESVEFISGTAQEALNVPEPLDVFQRRGRAAVAYSPVFAASGEDSLWSY